jgi:DNA-binding MarR family transcriptional regulator
MTKAYLKFLADQAEDKARIGLSANQVALLEYVFRETATGRVLRVQDLITLSEIASQATLHGALKGLIAKGLILAKADKTDGRVKEVVLAAQGKKYFERLEAALAKAVK